MTGDEFRQIREACKMTKRALGARWGVNERTIYGIETKAEVSGREADGIRFVALEAGVQRILPFVDLPKK